MAFTIDSVPDLTGLCTVITGANGGLGLQTAKVFAGKGAQVTMAVRNQEKAARAVAEIRTQTPNAALELVELDLASQASVKSAAKQILDTQPKIDILVNNAGLMATPDRPTADGYEMQFGVNHLGHWTFTALLMPALRAARAARVVTLTSMARFAGFGVDPKNPHMRGNYRPWRAYGESKFANYLFGVGLQREFTRAGVSMHSLIAHPGLTHSELQSTTLAHGGGGWAGPIWDWLAKSTGMEVPDGAMPQIRAATDPHAKGGQLYGPRFGSFGPPVRLPVLRPNLGKEIESLWRISERETGVALTI
jgi:NAD(P)-dependent dehydrogenase (short-subunit alcohol dehydrogenase family)